MKSSGCNYAVPNTIVLDANIAKHSHPNGNLENIFKYPPSIRASGVPQVLAPLGARYA